jgi:hypothetical protein
MTLADRIKIIDGMILENPDATIKDYIELVKDVEAIEDSVIAVPVIQAKEVERETPECKRRKIVLTKYLKTYKAHW